MAVRAARLLVSSALLAAAAACGSSAERPVPAGSPAAVAAYTSTTDGIAVHHPPGWHRALAPLAGAPVGDQVEILGLSTGVAPAPVVSCSPLPWSAMLALEPGGVVFTLRMSTTTTEHGLPPAGGARPESVLGSGREAKVEPPAGCRADGVALYEQEFIEHGRAYAVLVAARSPVGEDRRAEIERIWTSLRLEPPATAVEDGAALGADYFHLLYTHCGVRTARFDGREWVADPPLDDGQGNPPPGWANPGGAGTMRLVEPDRARFTTRIGGLTAWFRPRIPTDPPEPPCA